MGLRGEAVLDLLALLTAAATTEPHNFRRPSSGSLHMTCYDAVKLVIKPTTSATDHSSTMSYLDSITNRPPIATTPPKPALVGPATVFISHAWQANVFTVLNSIVAYDDAHKHANDDEADTHNVAYYWIDLCCVNQHREHQTTTFDQWKHQFTGTPPLFDLVSVCVCMHVCQCV